MSEVMGNWIGYVSGYGHIGFWNCTKEAARVAIRGKAEWEGGRFSLKPAEAGNTDHDVLLASGRAGCYDVGGRPEKEA